MGLRISELAYLAFDALTEEKGGLSFVIEVAQDDRSEFLPCSILIFFLVEESEFFIPSSPMDPAVCPIRVFKLYVTAVGGASGRLLRQFLRGKFTGSPLGINQVRKVPKSIAEFLDLAEPEKYTGHSFRRSSASALADAGASREVLKRHGGWKSDAVAEVYVAKSKKFKRDVGSALATGSMNQVPLPTSSSTTGTEPSTVHFHQCTFNGPVNFSGGVLPQPDPL